MRRLGYFSKKHLVRLPECEVIESLTPQSFTNCGLGSVVAIGDCTDIATEGCSASVLTSAEMHSDKTKQDAALGLAFVTPTGYVCIATDLFCGRTSEAEACYAAVTAFAKIPHKNALMYDKGVAKLQVHLPNMNQVLTLTSPTLTLT